MAEPEKQQSRQLTVQEQMKPIRDLLDKESFKSAVQGVLPKYMTPERLVKVALSAISRNFTLRKCTPMSIAGAIMQGAEMGLEVGGGLGHGYLVPFKNRHTGFHEAQFIPGYRGLIFLAHRGNVVRKVDAWLVHEKDRLVRRIVGGEDDYLLEPAPLGEDPGKVLGGIARAILLDGTVKWIEMPESEIQKIRSRSKAKDDGPWVTDTDEMRKKTLFRRLCKNLPIPPDIGLAKALSRDTEIEEPVEGEEDVFELEAAEVETAFEPPPEKETVPAQPRTIDDAAKKLDDANKSDAEKQSKGKKKKTEEPPITPQVPPNSTCDTCYGKGGHVEDQENPGTSTCPAWVPGAPVVKT